MASQKMCNRVEDNKVIPPVFAVWLCFLAVVKIRKHILLLTRKLFVALRMIGECESRVGHVDYRNCLKRIVFVGLFHLSRAG